MLCNSCVRSVLTQAGHIGRYTEIRQLSNIWRGLNATQSLSYLRKFPIRRKMMVDTGATSKGGLIGDVLPERENDGGYASGGWKSEDGRLSCGYSSFRGKRASMEDFNDIKTSKIDGRTVCLFGIFDGHGGSRAAEFLKEHLFENLTKHPEFITDTKKAISETYKQTDDDFLESEKDTFRDDGSTASTAVLVGNHLYVANVGDSRTIISKAGKAIALSDDHKPNRSDERRRIESAGGVVMWAGKIPIIALTQCLPHGNVKFINISVSDEDYTIAKANLEAGLLTPVDVRGSLPRSLKIKYRSASFFMQFKFHKFWSQQYLA